MIFLLALILVTLTIYILRGLGILTFIPGGILLILLGILVISLGILIVKKTKR